MPVATLMGQHAKLPRSGTVDVDADAAVLDPIDARRWDVSDLDLIVRQARQLHVDAVELWPS